MERAAAEESGAVCGRQSSQEHGGDDDAAADQAVHHEFSRRAACRIRAGRDRLDIWRAGDRRLAFGLFGWLVNIVPMWTWYRFPSDFIVGNLLEQGIGWLLGGIAIAWWLGRR